MLRYRTNDDQVRIYVADCRKALSRLPAGCAQLVFAAPPVKLDGEHDPWSGDDDEFWEFTCDWVEQCVRLLSPDGSMFTYVPPQLANWMACLLEEEHGLTFVNDICIVQNRRQQQVNTFAAGHQRLTYHCKRPDVRIWNVAPLLPNSCVDLSEAAKIIPTDVWGCDEPHFDVIRGVNRERQPLCRNQVPEKVLERVITATTAKGDLIIDPFAGSGVTAAVAKALGRRCVGCELDKAAARSAIRRAARGPSRVSPG